MNCNNCGSLLKQGVKFCRECGKQVEGLEETRVQAVQEVAATAEAATTTATTTAAVAANGAAALNVTKNWAMELLSFIKVLLKNPEIKVEEIDRYVTKSNALMYMLAIIVSGAILQLFTIKVMSNKIMDIIDGAFYYLSSFMNVRAGGMLQDGIGFKFIIYNTIYVALLMAIITGAVVLIYRVIMKYNIGWEDCIKLMLMPLLVLTCGSLLMFVLAFISLKYTVFVYLIVLFMFSILVIMQVINKLGYQAKVIYTMPAIYLICVALQMYIGFKFFT